MHYLCIGNLTYIICKHPISSKKLKEFEYIVNYANIRCINHFLNRNCEVLQYNDCYLYTIYIIHYYRKYYLNSLHPIYMRYSSHQNYNMVFMKDIANLLDIEHNRDYPQSNTGISDLNNGNWKDIVHTSLDSNNKVKQNLSILNYGCKIHTIFKMNSREKQDLSNESSINTICIDSFENSIAYHYFCNCYLQCIRHTLLISLGLNSKNEHLFQY